MISVSSFLLRAIATSTQPEQNAHRDLRVDGCHSCSEFIGVVDERGGVLVEVGHES